MGVVVGVVIVGALGRAPSEEKAEGEAEDGSQERRLRLVASSRLSLRVDVGSSSVAREGARHQWAREDAASSGRRGGGRLGSVGRRNLDGAPVDASRYLTTRWRSKRTANLAANFLSRAGVAGALTTFGPFVATRFFFRLSGV